MGLGTAVEGLPCPQTVYMVATGLPCLWDNFYNLWWMAQALHPLPLAIVQGKNVTLGSSFSFWPKWRRQGMKREDEWTFLARLCHAQNETSQSTQVHTCSSQGWLLTFVNVGGTSFRGNVHSEAPNAQRNAVSASRDRLSLKGPSAPHKSVSQVS